MSLTQVQKHIKEGKKNNYDREVCPNIDTLGKRCKDCCFWLKLTRVKILNGERALKIYGVDGEINKKNKEKLFAINYSGCAILTEICPDCIVDISQYKHKDNNLVPIRDSEYNQEVVLQPALLDYNNKKKYFYCELCEKKFQHKDVKHLINTWLLIRIKHPDWFKKNKKNKNERRKKAKKSNK